MKTINTKTEKRQTRKVGVAGGFINQVMGNNATLPKVGEGATILHYSDRDAYEVIEVSENGLQCVIREMDCKFVGQYYGDERYTFSSNELNRIITLEWNAKKQCWGQVYSKIEIIKTLKNEYCKKYGYGWIDFLLSEKGLNYDDIVDGEKSGIMTKYKLIEGLTKEYKVFNKVSVIFGTMDKYRDPHF